MSADRDINARDQEVFEEEEEDSEALRAQRYLLFSLGNETFGICIVRVTEIVEMQRITEVPDMPSYVKGVINLRGRVIPAVDLRLRFGMQARQYDDRNCIVIATVGPRTVGFIVDTVAEVHDIPQREIEPPPGFTTGANGGGCISGIGKVGEKVTVLIDADRLVDEKAMHGAAEMPQQLPVGAAR